MLPLKKKGTDMNSRPVQIVLLIMVLLAVTSLPSDVRYRHGGICIGAPIREAPWLKGE